MLHLRINCQCLKSGSFRQAEHKVHILDGLPGRPLDQVIDAADNDEPPGPLVNGGVDEAEIVPQGMLGVGWEVNHPDKGLILVEVQVEFLQLSSPFFPAAILPGARVA